MIELLYLVAGIMLTLAMDQVKVLTAKYVESQEERKKSLATYRPNPAVMQGTPEAHRAIAEHQHRQAVAPELRRLSWKINLAQAVPFALYALATTALVVAIIMLKRGNG